MNDLDRLKELLNEMSERDRAWVAAQSGFSLSAMRKIMTGDTENPGYNTVQLLLESIQKQREVKP
jgi:hypothetical protein